MASRAAQTAPHPRFCAQVCWPPHPSMAFFWVCVKYVKAGDMHDTESLLFPCSPMEVDQDTDPPHASGGKEEAGPCRRCAQTTSSQNRNCTPPHNPYERYGSMHTPPPLPRSNYSICCLIRLFFLHSNRYSKFASPGSNQLRINANACSCREAAEAPLPRRWTRNAQPSGRQLQVNQDREEAAAARAAAAVNAPAAPRRCVVCFSTVSSY